MKVFKEPNMDLLSLEMLKLLNQMKTGLNSFSKKLIVWSKVLKELNNWLN